MYIIPIHWDSIAAQALVAIAVARCQYDPFAWDNRSYHVAHQWLSEHWAEVTSGDVVDVEFILGETPAPKRSEA